MGIRIKRASEPATDDDGTRVLVDRYWPRGVQRDDAHIDIWCHEVAPTPELIAWYGRKIERWDEFKQRYWKELQRPDAAARLDQLRVASSTGQVTLVYGSRDREHNGARAMVEYLDVPVVEAPTSVLVLRTVPPPPLPAPRPRDTKPSRFRVPEFLAWSWMLVGLAVPIILLLGGEALVLWGHRAVVALGTLLVFLCILTIAKACIEERRTREAMGIPASYSDGRASILVPVQELGLAVVGYALGFAVLVVVLVFLSGLARLVG